MNVSSGKYLNVSSGIYLNVSSGTYLNVSSGIYLNVSSGIYLNVSSGIYFDVMFCKVEYISMSSSLRARFDQTSTYCAKIAAFFLLLLFRGEVCCGGGEGEGRGGGR